MSDILPLRIVQLTAEGLHPVPDPHGQALLERVVGG
jgi:hypothetical protein